MDSTKFSRNPPSGCRVLATTVDGDAWFRLCTVCMHRQNAYLTSGGRPARDFCALTRHKGPESSSKIAPPLEPEPFSEPILLSEGPRSTKDIPRLHPQSLKCGRRWPPDYTRAVEDHSQRSQDVLGRAHDHPCRTASCPAKTACRSAPNHPKTAPRGPNSASPPPCAVLMSPMGPFGRRPIRALSQRILQLK